MNYQLSFNRVWNYDAGQSGITVPVTLRLVSAEVAFDAKIDTGATDCVFARRFGEELGLEIETGEKNRFSAATGLFTAYGHEITISVLDYAIDGFVFFAEDENFNRNVLGRHSFLEQVILGLVDYEGKLYLNAYE